MADRYLVPGLQDYATHMFEYMATRLCKTLPEWPNVVDLVFSITREYDELRDVASEISSKWCSKLEFRDKMRPIMRKHGDFASRVLGYTSPLPRDHFSSTPGAFRKRRKGYLLEGYDFDGENAFKRAHDKRIHSLEKTNSLQSTQ